MYEFHSAKLQEAVHQALGYPALSAKKLAKAAAKFDFTARMRMGSVLFAGEGNLSFAMAMSHEPRVPISSNLATVYEAEEDLTNTTYDNAQKLLKLGCNIKTGVDATRLSDTIGKRQLRTIIFQFPNARPYCRAAIRARLCRSTAARNAVSVARCMKSCALATIRRRSAGSASSWATRACTLDASGATGT